MTDLTEAPFFNTRLLHEPRDWATGRIRASVVRYADRPPDEIIGDPGRPHFNRWHMIQRNRWLNVYAHQFLRSDDDRALHDHPWPSISLVLCGSYIEHEIKAGGVHVMTMRKTGDLIFRMPSSAHRIELPADSTTACWTLFITGPKVREWGFHCPDRWVHWTQFDGRNQARSMLDCLQPNQTPDALPSGSGDHGAIVK
jgi:hypothetical protein